MISSITTPAAHAYGDATELAVRAFQRAEGLNVDGKNGPKSHAALLDALERDEEPEGQLVYIDGGNCSVRDAPNTDGKILGVAHKGDVLAYAGETAENGWIKAKWNDEIGWGSGKYGIVK